MVDTLQTLGICVGAIALVVIAYSAFILSTAVVMATDDDYLEVEDEGELASALIREMSRKTRK